MGWEEGSHLSQTRLQITGANKVFDLAWVGVLITPTNLGQRSGSKPGTRFPGPHRTDIDTLPGVQGLRCFEAQPAVAPVEDGRPAVAGVRRSEMTIRDVRRNADALIEPHIRVVRHAPAPFWVLPHLWRRPLSPRLRIARPIPLSCRIVNHFMGSVHGLMRVIKIGKTPARENYLSQTSG
jgi:hypothetical protein